MDIMQIKTDLGKSIISKLITRKLNTMVKNGTMKVDLQDLEAGFKEDGFLRLHIEGDLMIHNSDLLEILMEVI